MLPALIDDRPDAARARLGAGTDRRVIRPDQVDWAERRRGGAGPGGQPVPPRTGGRRGLGVSVTTAMAVWLEDFADAPVVAVTGTKGKSTTAALAALDSPPPRASRWPSSATSGFR